MNQTRKHAALISIALAVTLLLFAPLRSALSFHSNPAPSDSEKLQGVVTSLSQAAATLSLDPEAAVELRLCLLLTQPMLEVPSQKNCRVVTTLAYCAVAGSIQDSIDVQANTVELAGSEPVNAWVDYTVDGTEQSYEVSLHPRAGFLWGRVRGLQDVSIQASRL